MACRLCGSADHHEEVCPAYHPSGELEAVSVRMRTSSHPAARPFRDCRAQVRLALSQREEDPARVWLELVSVRENATKLPELAADDPVLSQEVERFRAKLEAEIFALTQEVGDEVLAPLYVWLDLIRRRNELDREILVARQHVKEARASRLDTSRAPRTHEETDEQLGAVTTLLEKWRASAPPAPPERALEVWRSGGWASRTGELPQDAAEVTSRGEAGRALLAWPPAKWPIGKPPFVGTPYELFSIAGAGFLALVFSVLLAVCSGSAAVLFAVLAVLTWISVGALIVAAVWLRGRARKELEAAVAVVWHVEYHAQRARSLESEVGWIRALLDGFRARRAFDESKAEGKQIEDLKLWRPDLRDFVVEVAKQRDDPRAAMALESLRP